MKKKISFGIIILGLVTYGLIVNYVYAQNNEKEAVNKAYDYLIKGMYDEAISECNNAIAFNPNYANAYCNRGFAYEKKGDIDQALADYNKALQLNTNFAEAYNNRGVVYKRNGNLSQALSDYNKAIEIKPNYAEPYRNRGDIYAERGNLNKAIDDFARAIKLNPDFADAYYDRGTVYDKKGSEDQAIADLTKAIELNSNYIKSAYLNRGTAFYKKKDINRAITDYTKALAIDSKDADAYYGRGIAYFVKRDFDKSIADYTQAINLKPNYANAYHGRAISYYLKKEYSKAYADASKAKSLGIRINPEDFTSQKRISSTGIVNYFPIFIFVILALIGLVSQKSKIKVLNNLSSSLQGRVTKFTFTPSFVGEYQGLNFRVILTPASRSSPAYLTISITKGSVFKLKITHIKFYLAEMELGIAHKVKTGDAMFDEEFLVLSNQPDQAMNYLSNSDTKNTIREFFNAGFNAFLINGKQVLIRKPNYKLNEDLDPQNIKTLLQKLSSLTNGIM